jgi:hypothetical protein
VNPYRENPDAEKSLRAYEERLTWTVRYIELDPAATSELSSSKVRRVKKVV